MSVITPQNIFATTATEAWIKRLQTVAEKGAGREARGIKCYDLMNASTGFNMNYPIVTSRERKIGYRFMAAEAWWILAGKNDVESIRPYAATIPNFSDDTVTFNGAYGPMVRDQLSYIAQTIANDRETRQAVMTIWRPNPRPSKDIPCTVSIQWLLTERKGTYYLNCLDNMRSSDIWLGWVYDVFNFTMISHYLRYLLAYAYDIEVEMGELWLNAGSQHLYERNTELADKVINADNHDDEFNFTRWLDNNAAVHPEHLTHLLRVMAEENTIARLVKENSWPKEE